MFVAIGSELFQVVLLRWKLREKGALQRTGVVKK